MRFLQSLNVKYKCEISSVKRFVKSARSIRNLIVCKLKKNNGRMNKIKIKIGATKTVKTTV